MPIALPGLPVAWQRGQTPVRHPSVTENLEGATRWRFCISLSFNMDPAEIQNAFFLC
jgi:hypothetical protein